MQTDKLSTSTLPSFLILGLTPLTFDIHCKINYRHESANMHSNQHNINCMQKATNSQTQHGTVPYTYIHPFNGLSSRTTRVSRYQKGKTNLDFTGARDSEWQWHQLGHMQVCTSLQTDNHASTPPLKFFYSPDAFPAAQPTASKHWRHSPIHLRAKSLGSLEQEFCKQIPNYQCHAT